LGNPQRKTQPNKSTKKRGRTRKIGKKPQQEKKKGTFQDIPKLGNILPPLKKKKEGRETISLLRN